MIRTIVRNRFARIIWKACAAARRTFGGSGDAAENCLIMLYSVVSTALLERRRRLQMRLFSPSNNVSLLLTYGARIMCYSGINNARWL